MSFAAYNWADTGVIPILFVAATSGTFTGTPVTTSGGGGTPDIDTAVASYAASNLGTSVNPSFTGGTIDADTNSVTDDLTVDNSGGTIRISGGLNSTFSGVISNAAGAGTGNLTIGNAGTGGSIIFTGTNTYTGGTTINSGASLGLGNAGTAGMITCNVTNNGALQFNRSDAVSFAGVVSGTGSVTQSGPNQVTLTANNTYTGGTTINSGGIIIGADSNLGDTTGLLSINGGALYLMASFTMARNINIGGAGGLIDTSIWQLTTGGSLIGGGNLQKAGMGAWTLNGDSSNYTGTLLHSA